MAKILHIMLDCFYKNGYGYQENLLPAKHRQLGYDVEIISYYQDGDEAEKEKGSAPVSYINPDGIPVHILERSNSVRRHIPFVVGWTYITKGLDRKLIEVAPDIIFMHGICRIDNFSVIKYCKQHPNVVLFADNHSDYYNTPVDSFREKSFRYGVGRFIGALLNKYAKRVWGVTPWRVKYQEDVYGINSEKSSLLVMGGDESKIKWNDKDSIRKSIRSSLNIPQTSFVIITGGKIDKTKNIHHLLNAVARNPHEDIHVILFGRFERDMEEYARTLSDARIHNVGWITPTEANDYYLASDLACFPGTHSVLWEQACACGVPAIFKDWDGGFAHVDVGGNCILLKDVTEDTLDENIHYIINNNDVYENMKTVAETKARKEFSYLDIAKRSIEIE